MSAPMTVRHLVLAVLDEERSRRFYERHLGFGARTPRRYSDSVLMPHPDGYVLEYGWEPGPVSEPGR
jgi:catechol 2,3-dioxygenase-like lactoylglutathione lyase family enzyme